MFDVYDFILWPKKLWCLDVPASLDLDYKTSHSMAFFRRMARTSSHDPNSVLLDVRMQQRCELSTLAEHLWSAPKLWPGCFFWGWWNSVLWREILAVNHDTNHSNDMQWHICLSFQRLNMVDFALLMFVLLYFLFVWRSFNRWCWCICWCWLLVACTIHPQLEKSRFRRQGDMPGCLEHLI